MSVPPDVRLSFGLFLAPYHAAGENPTLALERDLDLMVHVDRLGFDEVWVGEHHSTGWETIASPEMFLVAAAERTRHVRLGTGAVSLPYHHPLMVADRIVLLDHLTRGRVNFGVGPGGHITDGMMLGLEPARLRHMMEESLEVIVRLLTGTEPVTCDADWFRIRDGVLQLRPYQRPHPPIFLTSMESPAGPALAGRFGAGLLSLSVAKSNGAPVDLASQWAVAEDAAAAAGRAMRREDWRLVLPIHLAETRREALDSAREGAGRFLLEYVEGTTGRPRPVPGPGDLVIEQMAERGSWIVGTPDDCADAIERLWEISGGFGGLLVWGHEWASPEATRRSHELLARHVIPRFQGSLAGIHASNALAAARNAEINRLRSDATERAKTEYARRG
ncbi:MAG: LLM class flavin-dependent oxidoreductase [Actinomycetota bacterium]